jgi:hypothetical protein
MDARCEGFADARLDVDLDDLPSFPFAFNQGALLRDGLVAIHVEVDLFSGWIAVVPEHDLLGRLHVPHLCQLDAGSSSCGLSSKVILRSQDTTQNQNSCRAPGKRVQHARVFDRQAPTQFQLSRKAVVVPDKRTLEQ